MREFTILQRKAINSQINIPPPPPPRPNPLYRGCASHRKDKRNSLKGGEKERLSPICAEIGSHVCKQRYQLCQRWKNVSRCAPSFAPSHSRLPPSTTTTTPYPNPSIARFICVSHYRKWNVVPAKCINSEVGKLACCTPCSCYSRREGQEKAERTG